MRGAGVSRFPTRNIIINTDNSPQLEIAFAYGAGRMFGKWIDDNSRDNGYDQGDLIQNPIYIIESILRDELFVERDRKSDV